MQTNAISSNERFMADELLKSKEVAMRLRISLRTLETMIAGGTAPKYFWIGKSRRWKQQDVETWILERRGFKSTDQEGI
jgi:excisionase family DNA binding protein